MPRQRDDAWTAMSIAARALHIAQRNTNGSRRQGSWALIDDVVMLEMAFSQKATQRGSSPPETIARILLYELSGEQRPEVD